MNTAEMQNQLETASDAPGHFYKEKRLEPFSFGRQTCWQRCGYDKAESEFESKIAILFICTLGEEIFEDTKRSGIDILESARGYGIPFFRSLVAKWADEQGFTANNPEGSTAARIGFAIWKESKQSKFKVVPKVTGSNPDPNG